MVENSKIEWTHHTFNPWIGCTKVSPACDNCYAEALMVRLKTAEWGTGKPRKLTGDSNWAQPLKWNRQAGKLGTRYRVFCASLADVFDNEVPEEWRVRLWDLVYKTPNLDWLILTKRIGNAKHMLPLGAYRDGALPNLWLGISVVTQAEAERDIPKLSALPVKVRFLSMEPLLEEVDLRALKVDHSGRMNAFLHDRIHWVIVGGESGNNARPMHVKWARALRDQCEEFNIPFHFKQWGEWGYDPKTIDAGGSLFYKFPDGTIMQRYGKKANGRLLDGRAWDGYPLQQTKGSEQ